MKASSYELSAAPELSICFYLFISDSFTICFVLPLENVLFLRPKDVRIFQTAFGSKVLDRGVLSPASSMQGGV